MTIRVADEQDWSRIYPFFTAIVAAGEVPEAYDHAQHGLVGLHVMLLRP